MLLRNCSATMPRMRERELGNIEKKKEGAIEIVTDYQMQKLGPMMSLT